MTAEGCDVMRIVIVGAGQAAASMAARLRAKGHDGPLTVIGQEPAAPYQRPPLSKAYLLGDMALDRWQCPRCQASPGRYGH